MVYQLNSLKVKKAYRGRKCIGRGVFATELIPAGVVVSKALGIEVEEDNDYSFWDHTKETSFLALTVMPLANHSENCNVDFDFSKDYIIFTTTRDIQAGEELTIDYGSNYWDVRQAIPLEPKRRTV